MQRRLVHASVIALGLAPLARLVGAGLFGDLGANPVETITHQTGLWGLRLLLLCLAVTPGRRLLGWPALAPYRRTFGLLAFTYASLHFATWLALDHAFDGAEIVEDIAKRPWVTAGFTAFVCLLPLAITSTRAWQRRLRRRWTQLHRLVYVAGIAAAVHFLWLVKADLREPLIYAAILAALLGARLLPRLSSA